MTARKPPRTYEDQLRHARELQAIAPSIVRFPSHHPEFTTALVPCADHGASEWCYAQDDGTHCDAFECCCYQQHSPACAVDEHRRQAAHNGRNDLSASSEAAPGTTSRPGRHLFLNRTQR